MDVSLRLYPHTPPPITFHPLSSSSSYSIRPPSHGHNCIIRSNSRKFGHHRIIRSPQKLFVVRSSFNVQSAAVVFVSVVAVSGLSFVFFDYMNRNYHNAKKESSPSTPVKSERAKVITNQKILLDNVSAEESSESVKEVSGSQYESEVEQLKPKETTPVPIQTFVISKDKSPDTSTTTFSGEIEVGSSSAPLLIIPESTSEQINVSPEETKVPSDFAALSAENQLNVANGLLNGNEEEDGHKRTVGEFAEVDQISSYSCIFREPSRVALHTICQADKSAIKSRPKMSDLSSSPSHVSFRDYKRISSQRGKATASGVEMLTKNFVDVADPETVERNVPFPYYKEGSTYKSKEFAKSKGFSSEKKRRLKTRDGDGDSKPPSSSYGIHVNGNMSTEKNLPSKEISAYDKRLRAGRLADCLGLLQDKESKGLLDMDKVYHARFFKTCQSQKAVKEAFSFTKLIPNPTASTFNMLMSVCASSQDSESAFKVLQFVQEAGLEADCKLYTTLISTCAKCGKVDSMFKVFHEMVNAGVEPNVNTYGALIDGCAKAGQVAKAFGAYGIMRAKNVKPDRVIFNALITACGQSGAVDRAFDVLSEMGAETQPIDPDHITVGALMRACANSGQVHRAREVYDMIHKYNIKGSPEVYTIAVNSCSETGDWDFACSVYNDMKTNGIIPDEVFLSAMIDAAGHAGKLDAAFGILQEAKNQDLNLGVISYSSLMGACCKAKDWERALELYEDIKTIKLKPTVPTMNALITALCDGDQLEKAMGVLSEMKSAGLHPNIITYSILVVASEKKDDMDAGLRLLSEAKVDGLSPNLVMCRCILAMCLRRYEKACARGEPVLSFNGRSPQIYCKWTSLALTVYRETIMAGVTPTSELVPLILGCLRLPHDTSSREKIMENLGVSVYSRRRPNLCSLVNGFGEYDPRGISLYEEAASFGIVPCVQFKDNPIVVDVKELPMHTAEVYLLTVLKGLKYRRAAGAKLPNTIILLPVKEIKVPSSTGERTVILAGRVSQDIASVLRRVGLRYQGNESYGKIRIPGFAVKRWLQPKQASPFSGKQADSSSALVRLSKGISHQQRRIRTGNLSLW